MTDYDKTKVLNALDTVIHYAEVARSEVSKGDGRIQEVRFVNDLYPVDVLTVSAGTMWVLFETVEHLARVFGADADDLAAKADEADADEYEALRK